MAPARISALNRKDSNISESGSAPDSLLELYGSNSANRSGINSMDLADRKDLKDDAYANDSDPERSRWIHRDKLARIESQELQAAGIILPRSRAPSKSGRRERSRDQQSNGFSRSEQSGQYQKRQRVGSLPTEDSQEDMIWDLRLPEEAIEDPVSPYRDLNAKSASRIPVCKTSPLPIALEHIERDTPIQRSRSNGWPGDDEGIAYPKSRGRSDSVKVLEDTTGTPTPGKRSASDMSPTKKANTPGARKASATATRATSAQSRPKTRSGQKEAPVARPTTRSGELGQTVKQPEGDPPWLATMYKPDPRLPPDQQLLPTVARRLAQEKWEKEGKFGNTYDTQFRPLNDEEFQQQPEIIEQTITIPDPKPEEEAEWPLRGAKSPTLSTGRPGTAGVGSYSTMPKIQSALPSPRVIMPITPIRVQEPPEDTKISKKGGCGCCVVM